MCDDWTAAIIANDLDSMMLPAHPSYTDAFSAVQTAKLAIMKGRVGIHAREMQARHGGADD